jgi:hypothetical protein
MVMFQFISNDIPTEYPHGIPIVFPIGNFAAQSSHRRAVLHLSSVKIIPKLIINQAALSSHCLSGS